MHNNLLRPTTIEDFKGKSQIKKNLKVYVEAALNNAKSLDHILLHGIPGTGKTSLAFIVAKLLNTNIKIIQGSQLKKNVDLLNFLSSVFDNEVIFIDEIHAISTECCETLYSILEDGTIDIKLGVENNAKFTRIQMPKFTLIGATTSIGKISKPLEERFGIFFYFDLYNDDELIEIIQNSCKKLNLDLTYDEQNTICSHSKGIPRIANKIVKRVFDYKSVFKNMSIDNILKEIGIYKYGLDKIDINYLNAINNEGCVGLKTIMSITELDQQTIENRIEPFLIKNKFIQKTAKGRTLTCEGEKLINRLNKEINQL